MIRSVYFAVLGIVMCSAAFAAGAGNNAATGASGPAYSIFSTSTDWQALTGMSYSEYRISFIPDKKLIGKQGLILYYLDGFPCYGLGFGVRSWLGPRGEHDNDKMHIVCTYAPKMIQFAWRNATRDAVQAATTGLLECPVAGDGRDLTVDLSKCTRGPDWKDIR